MKDPRAGQVAGVTAGQAVMHQPVPTHYDHQEAGRAPRRRSRVHGGGMGPLDGVRVIEIASLAPAPFGCMVLADLGADVLRIDRAERCGPQAPLQHDPLSRGRRSVGLNLKDPVAIDLLLQLTGTADVLVEGFRPGVAERLGFGPQACAERNPRLIFARMTGWGQDGPLAPTAGHDIDYIAISGALGLVGRAGETPVPPVNLLGDFGGGGMLLALGILAALVERASSGLGQVVDAAMVDGSALLTSFLYGMRASGSWQDERGSNLLDGGAPFYDTYATSDGGHMAVGALEPQFYAALLHGLELTGAGLPAQHDRSGWPVLRQRFAETFASRTRSEWEQVFAGTDACVSPVLSLAEAPLHPHAVTRNAFIDVGGIRQPAPAPRFGRTAAGLPPAPPRPGADTDDVLAGLGLTGADIEVMRSRGVVG
jgi:alpha-methylacyl-CoA racemase